MEAYVGDRCFLYASVGGFDKKKTKEHRWDKNPKELLRIEIKSGRPRDAWGMPAAPAAAPRQFAFFTVRLCAAADTDTDAGGGGVGGAGG